MKKFLFVTILTLMALPLSGQGTDGLDIHINFQGALRGENTPGGLQGTFVAKDLRLDLRGNITDNLWYRFRRNIAKNPLAGTLDSFSRGTDFMMVGWRFAPKWKIEVGKFGQHMGGFEFDEIPMYIYRYSDYVDHLDIFYAGMALTFQPTPGQEFIFEVSNNLNNTFEDVYGTGVQLYDATLTDSPTRSVTAARFPFSYILNWNGSLFEGRLLTRWAAGLMHQTTMDDAVFLTLGQKFVSDRFQAYLDYMFELDGMDRLGIATADLPAVGNNRYAGVRNSVWILKANWQFANGWNLMAKASTTNVWVPGITAADFHRHYGAVTSLEFFPVQGQDMRFFLCGSADRYIIDGATRNAGRIELGLMYNLKCF